MHNKIRLLSDLLVNQIAAGEVIQRPASVVKELLDNAIDAASKTITIVIKEAGKQLIQVIDDGVGMGATDAQMCFEKHATSKISTIDDLHQIQTMGFRGEAMASMAAIAQVELQTRLHDAPVGTQIIIEASQIKKQTPIATAPGTKVSVKNLFYNVPARRKFLKSNLIELKHILEEVQRAALARSDISFILYHNEKEIYKLSAEKVSHRIVHLLGENYKKQLLPCKEVTDIVTVEGYIGKPEEAKKTRGEQFLFINQRFIKSPSLNHAIRTAYDRWLPADSFPFYAIYLRINPQLIDVNVHPTKTEIKCQDESTFYAILQAVVRKSLANYPIGDALDFEQNVNNTLLPLTHPIEIKTPFTSLEREKQYAQFKVNHVEKSPLATANWQTLFKDPEEATNANPTRDPLASVTGQTLQLYGSYLITQLQSGALLIDQQAAHERILYDKFSSYFQHKNGASQQLLIPEHLTFNPVDHVILLEHASIMRTLGFVMEAFGEATIIIYGFPIELSHYAPKPLLEGLIEQFKWHNSKLVLTPSERFIRALAKKASIVHGTTLNAIEIEALLAQLFASSNTMYTPDGQKICSVLPKTTLVDLLK
ncbi:DNA mismatch repair endonuclease MutL [Candidatus Cardinium hertigii]|uniref:DNA mismatch repair protein MutL n=1 Tax=Candidatus Cardinium hertigii TaxID=247481 RepID=A0A2Z3LHP0_9BACT|nr:DNA mismatch repair endonuclease MutL [Candidatus Cardinium hertigii]AWN82025.1 DNA mismatch repair protein MutL [Candidatus Cardinium hertigii]